MKWKRTWRLAIADALERAGCKRPEALTKILAVSLGGNDNPTTAWIQGSGVPPSTASTWKGETSWRVYLDAFNQNTQAAVRQWLRRFPPDRNEVFAVIDGHEEEYWMKRRENKRIPRERSRQSHVAFAAARNKRTRHCHLWLCVVLSWEHKGMPVEFPIRIELLTPLDRHPVHHLRIAEQACRAAGVAPSAYLMDRYYDAAEVRRHVKAQGLPSVQRIRHDDKRYFVFEDGTRRGLEQVFKEGANTYSQVHTGYWPESGEPYQYRLLQYKCRIGSEPDESVVTFQVGLHPPTGRRQAPRFTWRPERSMSLVAPVGISAETVRRLYLARHRIEVFFQRPTFDRSGYRAKTIQGHVLDLTARLYAAAIGTLCKIAAHLGQGMPRLKHVAPQHWSGKMVRRAMFGPIAA